MKVVDNIVFQFHKGTIKTFGFFWINLDWIYFNSIKVRLKHLLQNIYL